MNKILWFRFDLRLHDNEPVKEALKDGKTFYEIPYDIIEEYGRSDVEATEQVALKQLEAFGTTFEESFGDEETIADTAFVA